MPSARKCPARARRQNPSHGIDAPPSKSAYVRYRAPGRSGSLRPERVLALFAAGKTASNGFSIRRSHRRRDGSCGRGQLPAVRGLPRCCRARRVHYRDSADPTQRGNQPIQALASNCADKAFAIELFRMVLNKRRDGLGRPFVRHSRRTAPEFTSGLRLEVQDAPGISGYWIQRISGPEVTVVVG